MEDHVEQRISFRYNPPRAEIIINRPEKRNAMTYNMWKALTSYYRKACEDSSVKIIILRGEGGAFSAGDDIGEMESLAGIEEAKKFFKALEEAFITVLMCPKITVAVVDGPAVGGGGEILLLMDYVIASTRSRIGFPEIRIGLLPPVLSTLGVYILGLRAAKRLSLTGEIIDAREAQRLGIVDEVVEPESLMEAIERIEKLFSNLPDMAVESIKRLFNANTKPILEYGVSELIQLSTTSEAKSRMRLFLEKKLPRPS